ncbi:TetR/AcrR family transcriptional regulator [uncultured Aquimarina sp.]|uniref:TetR/AcrR family transcriptional regulator n=1 Tax=uncultured Aquimarina sp. TaxID=575652 RepID=UPI00260C78C2|nr:TetR/AcrR family transcriptional regulator [uncultured Aquimarina sp.]
MKQEGNIEDKYNAILNAADAIMQNENLGAMSISKVARKAKVAKGTVYLYFKDKEEIIGKLAIRARKLMLEYFKKYVGEKTNPLDRIKGIFYADYYYFKEQRAYHQLITFYEQNTGLTESGELADTGQAISSYINKIIQEAIDLKAIRQDIDSKTLSFMFWGMAIGIIQLLETRNQQLKSYLDNSGKEFYDVFVQTTVEGLTI